ncbi:MAG TPA: hypothetical protein VH083_27845 [Myxococcales bacterium]|jgi:hypothetical protein|nr:hypothetical protein [Myxococcales bacterium]
MKKSLLLIPALLMALTFTRPAKATTAGGTLVVSATVINICIISSAVVAFGNYNGSNTSTASFTVVCNPGSSPSSVTLGTSGTPFAMAFLTNAMPYNVTQGATAISPGDSLTPSAGTLNYPISLAVSSGLSLPIGVYTQTVPVTVTF